MLFNVLMGRKSIREYISSLKLRFTFKYRKIKRYKGKKEPKLKIPLKISNLQVVDRSSKEFSILTGEIVNKSARSVKNIVSTIQISDYYFSIRTERIAPFEKISFLSELSNSTLTVSSPYKEKRIVSKTELFTKPIILIETTYD